MIIAKVISRVVSSAKLASIPNRAMLSVEPLPGFGDPKVPLIALDSVGAGPGETVIILQEGTGARESLNPDDSKTPLPLQMVVVGIVDQIQT